MTPITRDEIEELERKAKAATEGPWFPHDFTEAPSDSPPSAHDVAVSCTTPDHILVASMGGGLWGPRGDAGILQAKLDADYIAAACPRATLRLIARIRELESENAELKAMKVAVQETPKQWSTAQAPTMEAIIGTARGMMDENRVVDLKAKNVDLMRRVGELEAALRPFADYANAINDKWPDSTGTSLLFKQTDGSLQHKPNISLGDCRIAAAVLAKGRPQ